MRQMEKVFEKIIKLEFKKTDTLEDCLNKFYAIMRDHGIKKGDKAENGWVICDNFNWTACYTLFKNAVSDFFVWKNLFIEDVPEDLQSHNQIR